MTEPESAAALVREWEDAWSSVRALPGAPLADLELRVEAVLRTAYRDGARELARRVSDEERRPWDPDNAAAVLNRLGRELRGMEQEPHE